MHLPLSLSLSGVPTCFKGRNTFSDGRLIYNRKYSWAFHIFLWVPECMDPNK